MKKVILSAVFLVGCIAFTNAQDVTGETQVVSDQIEVQVAPAEEAVAPAEIEAPAEAEPEAILVEESIATGIPDVVAPAATDENASEGEASAAE